MADNVDESADKESRLHELRIASIRAKQRELNPKGSCHWCAEVFTPGDPRVFCDTDCRADFDREKRRGR